MNPKTLDDLDRLDPLEWLVVQRSAIQSLLLSIHRPLEDAEPGGWTTTLAHLLLGIQFSLWRSIFLSTERRESGDKEVKAFHFVDVLVRENAITFSQDRKAEAWAGGYYLNNAYLRLSVAYDVCARNGVGFGLREHQRRTVQDWISRSATIEIPMSLRRSWNIAFDAAAELTGVLLEAVSPQAD